MEKYQISINDIMEHYFHFTFKSNLESIENQGLIPSLGKHAKYIKKLKKYYAINNSPIDLKNVCPILYEYLENEK